MAKHLYLTLVSGLLVAGCSSAPEPVDPSADFTAELEALAEQHQMTAEEVTAIKGLIEKTNDRTKAQVLLEAAPPETSMPGSTEPLPQQEEQAPSDSVVLATVNGQAVTEVLFQEAAARKRPADGQSLSADEKQEVLEGLVEDALLYQQALERGFQDNPKVQKVMVSSLLREDVYGKVRSSDFSDEELTAYFDEHFEDFVVPAKVQLRRILIRVTQDRTDEAAQAEAMRLYREIKADPTRFKPLAGEFSEDAYRKRAGELGFVTEEGKPGLDQAVVDRAFELPAETLSEPFLSSEGYNIIYVVNRRDRIERDFKKMKGSVLRKVKTEKLRQMYDDYLEGLRTRSEIVVDEDALGALEVKGRARPVGAGMAAAPAVPMGMDPHTQSETLESTESAGPATPR